MARNPPRRTLSAFFCVAKKPASKVLRAIGGRLVKFLRKIPLLIYAILLVGISIAVTRQIEIHLINIGWLTQNEGEARVALYSSVLTVIGIFYGVMQLQSQRKDSLFANEYINQPEFEFYELSRPEIG